MSDRADRIETLEDENKRLREALRELLAEFGPPSSQGYVSAWTAADALDEARTLLELSPSTKSAS